MMINTNYAVQVNQARENNADQVHFTHNATINNYANQTTDTVTLSSAAVAKMTGENLTEASPPTYIKPISAKSLLSAQQTGNKHIPTETDDRFSNMMQAILDKRLGVDREQLAELEAMMEEIAKNENMSPEEKQKAIEQLEKMREELIKESTDNKKVASQTFQGKDDNKEYGADSSI